MAPPSRSRRTSTTATYVIDDQTGELKPVDVGDVAAQSGALVIRSGGGRVGQSFPMTGEQMTIGRSPETDVFLDDVTVSREHATLVRRGGDWYLDDSGSLNGTYVNRQRGSTRTGSRTATSCRSASTSSPSSRADDGRDERSGRGRAARRRVEAAEAAPEPVARAKSLTIGAVCKALPQEFPDISISKIRYLEDQKLLDAAAHARRLPALLEQRRRAAAHDPAAAARRVPAAARDPPGARRGPQPRAEVAAPQAARRTRAPGAALRRLTFSLRDKGALYSLEDVVEETGAEPAPRRRARGLRHRRPARCAGNVRYYDETEREIVRAVTELSRYGVAGRNLRVFKTSAERESGAAAADPRPVAALAQPRAAQGGGGGAREPRRRRLAPQAPAARARPAPDRRSDRPGPAGA